MYPPAPTYPPRETKWLINPKKKAIISVGCWPAMEKTEKRTAFAVPPQSLNVKLGGGFKHFLSLTPKLGEDSHFVWYFWTGLKPPTSLLFSPRKLGKWSKLTHILQMGWKHQLVRILRQPSAPRARALRELVPNSGWKCGTGKRWGTPARKLTNIPPWEKENHLQKDNKIQ